MILKPPDSPVITPVVRVLPALPPAGIGDTAQELGARATQFVKGQAYIASVVSRADDKGFYVKVENALLKMDLGTSATVGQSIVLKYLHASPVPTFLLTHTGTPNSASATTSISPEAYLIADSLNNAEADVVAGKYEVQAVLTQTTNKLPDLLPHAGAEGHTSTTSISPAAHLIADTLKKAEAEGVSAKYEAKVVITNTPKAPAIVAQDLKQALSGSGLFYESHLGDYVAGHRSLAEIKQEPQNQLAAAANTLLPQQLSVLENQRLSWHGEVWPGQKMDWDVYLPHEPVSPDKQEGKLRAVDDPKPIASDLTLYLPNLGQVSARISLVDGRMRIRIQAEEAQTLATLKGESKHLADAIVGNGQALEGLTVASLEQVPHG